MPTTVQVQTTKANRLTKEARHFTPDLLGAKCVGGCGLAMPLVLLAMGERGHATCSPMFRRLAAADVAKGNNR